jgi:hypothetical protein
MPLPVAISQCMTELGPLLDAGEILEYPELSLWTIMMEGPVVVHAEYDEECRHLVLTADVAPVPAARQQDLYRLLLQYSSSSNSTSGVHFALDDTGETIELITSLSESELDSTRLHQIVLRFLQARNDWHEQITKAWSADNGIKVELPAPGDMANFANSLRV